MSKKTIKALREAAQDALKNCVGNREQLLAAVPTLVELQNAEKNAEMRLRETKAVIEALSRECSAYAHEHPKHVFGETFAVSPIGVESGYLEIDGVKYHFSHGFEGYTRSDHAEKMTQGFLKGLPKGWARSKLELDTTAINNAKPSEDELDAAGLERKVKCRWSEM